MTGQLTPDILLSAYRVGIFPMAKSATDKNIFWVDPKYRGIMPLNKFHVSKSLRRAIMKLDYQISVNTSFEKVIKMCAKKMSSLISQISMFVRGLSLFFLTFSPQNALRK